MKKKRYIPLLYAQLHGDNLVTSNFTSRIQQILVTDTKPAARRDHFCSTRGKEVAY